MNRKQREAAAAAQAAACDAAREAGRDHYRTDPEALLAAVHRVGSKRFPDSKDTALAFVEGYQQARAQRDAFLKGD